MSWLSVLANNNRNFVGNALKNVAPVVGALTGGIGGVALGGLGAALGQGLRKGSNIGDILKTGAQNAAITSAGQKAVGGIKGVMAKRAAAQAAAQAARAGLPIAPGAGIQPFGGLPPVGAPTPGVAGPLDIPAPSTPNLTPFTRRTTLPAVTITAPANTSSVGTTAPDVAGSMGTVPVGIPPMGIPAGGPSGVSTGSWLGNTASWLDKHDKLAELGLRGLTTGIEGITGRSARAAQERLSNAQAARIEQEIAQAEATGAASQNLREMLIKRMTERQPRKHLWEE